MYKSFHSMLEEPRSSVLSVSEIKEVLMATEARLESAVLAAPRLTNVWSPVLVPEMLAVPAMVKVTADVKSKVPLLLDMVNVLPPLLTPVPP